MRQFTAAVLAAGLAGWAAAGDGPVTITLKRPAAGDTVEVVATEETASLSEAKGNGRATAMKGREQARFEYTDEVLEGPDAAGRPTKVRRTYKTAEHSTDGATDPLGLAGRTVVIERKDGKLDFTPADGKLLSPAEAAVLTRDLDGGPARFLDAALPPGPVRVNAPWRIDPKGLAGPFAEYTGMALDPAKSSATGTLTRVYQKDGRTFGVLKLAIDFALVTPPADGGFKLKAGSRATGELVRDLCLDGSDPTFSDAGALNVVLDGEATGAAAGPPMPVTVTLELKPTTSVRRLPKK